MNMTVGTVAYPPEQLMGLDIDGRADHYALVATAYHLLTVRSWSRTPIPGSEADFRDTAPRRSLAPAPGCAGVAYVVNLRRAGMRAAAAIRPA
jgi:hypothetical protein